ncbi:hypothetical protein L6452_36959 [Arctium lappa]|uniref:Uncharacterized protein n=1 Tax=Arctium lappa TaxID=4217 RepID=A0ACB8Y242_ARCLA|nr:hypothetical protein L6452_36959 [Arctium lappa]
MLVKAVERLSDASVHGALVRTNGYLVIFTVEPRTNLLDLCKLNPPTVRKIESIKPAPTAHSTPKRCVTPSIAPKLLEARRLGKSGTFSQVQCAKGSLSRPGGEKGLEQSGERVRNTWESAEQFAPNL